MQLIWGQWKGKAPLTLAKIQLSVLQQVDNHHGSPYNIP
jgi:hypothetical protein